MMDETTTPRKISAGLYRVDLPGGNYGQITRRQYGWEAEVYNSKSRKLVKRLSTHPTLKAALSEWDIFRQ